MRRFYAPLSLCNIIKSGVDLGALRASLILFYNAPDGLI